MVHAWVFLGVFAVITLILWGIAMLDDNKKDK